MSFDTARPGGIVDDDIGEITAAGLAQPEPVKLDLGAEREDRFPGSGLACAGAVSISTCAFSKISRPAAVRMRQATISAEIASPSGNPARTAISPMSTAIDPPTSPAK